jgi:hypothetical protein
MVGTASWSDPGFFADWYPPGLPKNRLLPWYAEHFSFAVRLCLSHHGLRDSNFAALL